ncbi:hypothetical protein AC579_4741 [Pseudocercospora musae]|uniref:RRM domain-containing protein n=1 Tax=Pseudocercospora musae TaxID=113226 RepID=A0A139IQ01_9PEZI|nr:hypothetical protein AC579_4741 [Pseudocercospora musae]
MAVPSSGNLPSLRDIGDPFDDDLSHFPTGGATSFRLDCTQARLDRLAKLKPFPIRASKEVDSGIKAHETPDEALHQSPPSSPSSVASAPASLGSQGTTSETNTTTDSTTGEADVEETHVVPPKLHRFGAFVVELRPSKLPYLMELFNWSQRSLPADACLFVGNLPASLSNHALTVQVHELFAQYGTCYVRVGRVHASPQKPYALVQFQSVPVADSTRRHCFQFPLVMGGRALRVLPSTARRIIKIAPRPGTNHDLRLAVDMLMRFVPVESVAWGIHRPMVEVRFHHHGDFLWAQYLVNNGVLGAAFVMF